jgi:hypothetical protein
MLVSLEVVWLLNTHKVDDEVDLQKYLLFYLIWYFPGSHRITLIECLKYTWNLSKMRIPYILTVALLLH